MSHLSVNTTTRLILLVIMFTGALGRTIALRKLVNADIAKASEYHNNIESNNNEIVSTSEIVETSRTGRELYSRNWGHHGHGHHGHNQGHHNNQQHGYDSNHYKPADPLTAATISSYPNCEVHPKAPGCEAILAAAAKDNHGQANPPQQIQLTP